MPEVTFLDGTVRFLGIEGGFWTIRGDNGVTYDLSGLAKDFQQVGLRVHLVTRERKERGIDRLLEDARRDAGEADIEHLRKS